MIANTIGQKITDALKAKDSVKLSTLRLLSSSFNYEKIAKQHDLTEEEEIAVIKREAKKRSDAIDFLKTAQGKTSTSDKDTLEKRLVQEEAELRILKEFLPDEMGEEELEKIIDEVIEQVGARSLQDMGKVIGAVIQKTGGRADGKKVSELVKSKLT